MNLSYMADCLRMAAEVCPMMQFISERPAVGSLTEQKRHRERQGSPSRGFV
jgi:hypothetical protein